MHGMYNFKVIKHVLIGRHINYNNKTIKVAVTAKVAWPANW
jgi:hypothetical protein